MKRNNKGFTLIELIVCILILSMISGIIVMFVSSSVNSYNVIYNEVNMQTEADVAMTYINELAIEAKDYKSTGAFVNSMGAVCTALCMEAQDNSGVDIDAYYIIWHQSNDNTMRFIRLSKNDSALIPLLGLSDINGVRDIDVSRTLEGLNVYNSNSSFLCKYVTEFVAIPPTDPDTFPVLQVQISLEFAGSTFRASKNIASRNLS